MADSDKGPGSPEWDIVPPQKDPNPPSFMYVAENPANPNVFKSYVQEADGTVSKPPIYKKGNTTGEWRDNNGEIVLEKDRKPDALYKIDAHTYRYEGTDGQAHELKVSIPDTPVYTVEDGKFKASGTLMHREDGSDHMKLNGVEVADAMKPHTSAAAHENAAPAPAPDKPPAAPEHLQDTVPAPKPPAVEAPAPPAQDHAQAAAPSDKGNEPVPQLFRIDNKSSQNGPDGIYQLNTDGTIVKADRVRESMSGAYHDNSTGESVTLAEKGDPAKMAGKFLQPQNGSITYSDGKQFVDTHENIATIPTYELGPDGKLKSAAKDTLNLNGKPASGPEHPPAPAHETAAPAPAPDKPAPAPEQPHPPAPEKKAEAPAASPPQPPDKMAALQAQIAAAMSGCQAHISSQGMASTSDIVAANCPSVAKGGQAASR